MSIAHLTLLIMLLPLIGSIIVGVSNKFISKTLGHTMTTGSIAIAFCCSLYLAKLIFIDQVAPLDHTVYTWAVSGQFSFDIGFLVDRLSTVMLLVVTFVSLLVHLYSVGYMAEDAGYQRFLVILLFLLLQC